MGNDEYLALRSALEWHLDAGADAALGTDAVGLIRSVEAMMAELAAGPAPAPVIGESVKSSSGMALPPLVEHPPLGTAEARAEALQRAEAASTVAELRETIAAFDGISLKGTATNLVFADGSSTAPIMLVGDAPGAEDDRGGRAFAGPHGNLLDQILKTAAIGRAGDDVTHIYMSNILNWRPPGGRSPLPAELEISLPFIERHIQLVQPRLLILCGGLAAKTLLGRTESISKLRGRFHDYTPQTPEWQNGAKPIPAIAVFDPVYLVQNPLQKRQIWADMLMILEKKSQFGL
jgi:uracil-DNA glycosylase family 4